MLSPLRKIIISFILPAFVLAAFFGFAAMSYGPNGQMQGDCPFSAGMPQCPQNAVAAAVHHLSAYQSFLNVPVGLGFFALILALGVIGFVLAVLIHPPPLLIPAASSGPLYTSPFSISYNKKLMRWLSLFEHIPSFS